MFASQTVAQIASAPAAEPFEVTHYDIKAHLFPSTHVLTATVAINFIPAQQLTSMSLRLASSLHVKKAEIGGKPVNFDQKGLALNLAFANPIATGQPSSVTVTYEGTLNSADGSPYEGLKLAYVAPEGSYLLYPACWFPVNGSGLDRFTAMLAVTVPPDETVIASGTASAPERAPGETTYRFKFDKPSFPGTVIAGHYAVQPATLAGADVTLYLKSGSEKFASAYGDAAASILGYFSDKFGPLPNGHLALVEIDNGTLGGYAAPGVVALATRGFTEPVDAKLLAHEVSRQWWNCLMSPETPSDTFLDEGLATYSSALYEQRSAGEATFEDTMHQIAVGALTHEEAAPIAQAARLEQFTPEYESIVVQKGAMVFHMLRWVIGDEAFFKTLQAMTKTYAWKPVSTEDFEKLAEQAAHQKLTYFFAQWVNSTGVPQFKRTWAVYRTQTGYQVVGKIQQDLDIFRMPVDIRVYPEGRLPVDERIQMVGTTADFTVNALTRPTKVVVDPASEILKFDDRIKTEVELAKADQLDQQQAYLEAVKQYQQVLALDKNNSLAHYRIGEIFFKLRNYNAAAEAFREALAGDLQPKWVEVWSHLMLGELFDATGQRDRALNEYQRALQTNDNTQGALDLANKYIQKPYSGEVGHEVG